jgi:DNA-binding transcriptional LysR family regulator
VNLRPTVHLSIDLLETFVTVIRQDGDAAQAARTLDINQPSMSKRLAFLQHSSGILKRPWLRRVGKTWLLTDEGQRVLPVVHDLLHRYHNLNGYTNAARPTPTSVLRFACGQTAGSFLIRRALQQFRRRFPDAQIRISTMRAAQRIAGVAGGAIDMALVGRENSEIDELARSTRLHIETIGRFGYCMACAKNSPWSSKFKKLPRTKPLSLPVLAEFPLIVPEPDSRTRQILDPLIHRQSWANKVEYRIEIGGWLTILDYVRAGLGVGLVSEMALSGPDAKNLMFRPLSDSRLGTMALKLITRAADHEAEGTSRNNLSNAWRMSLKGLIGK